MPRDIEIMEPSGVTMKARLLIKTLSDALKSLFPKEVRTVIVQYTNLEGSVQLGRNWQELSDTQFFAYCGVLVLAGVFRSSEQNLSELWEDGIGPVIFAAK